MGIADALLLGALLSYALAERGERFRQLLGCLFAPNAAAYRPRELIADVLDVRTRDNNPDRIDWAAATEISDDWPTDGIRAEWSTVGEGIFWAHPRPIWQSSLGRVASFGNPVRYRQSPAIAAVQIEGAQIGWRER
jgi:hypothetical protein